jgi:hypothetical protein
VPGTAVLLIRRAATRPAASADGSLSLADDFDPPARRELRVRLYYVARQSDGDARTPALRVKSLTAVAGVPAFVDTEVMPGVEDLQIELLPEAGAARRAHVQVRVRADASDVPQGAAVPVLEISRRFTLRNAPPG